MTTSPGETRRVSIARLRTTSSSKRDSNINEYLSKFAHEIDTYVTISKQFSTNLREGLQGNSTSSLKPTRTHVSQTSVTEPLNADRSECLYVDFGGSYFRIGFSSYILQNGKPFLHTESQVTPLPKNASNFTIGQVFEYIANRVKNFARQVVVANLKTQFLPVAFIWSFPCTPGPTISSAMNRRFTKLNDLEVDSVDVGKGLQEALDNLKFEKPINFQVKVVMNDVTACLLSFCNANIYDSQQNVKNPENCQISMICGLGCNAGFYCSDLSEIINTEWGGYGEKGELEILQTDLDMKILNEISKHSGEQAMEKLGVSDIYMGELVRLIMIDLMRKGFILQDNETDDISKPFCLTGTGFVSQVLKAAEFGLMNQVQDILVKFNLYGLFSDCEAIVNICTAVTRRAAKLVGSLLSGIVANMNTDVAAITVACDGGLYRKHPFLNRWIERYANEVLTERKIMTQVRLQSSTLSSGPGAVACTLGHLYAS